MRQTKRFITLFLLVTLLGLGALAEGDPPAKAPQPEDFTGEWRVLLENSNGKKYIRFSIVDKDKRLRGKMKTRDYGTQELDGRKDDDGTLLFWSTYTDRAGGTTDTSFKGTWDGEAIVGKGRFFDKPVTFRAEKVEPKEKKTE